MPFTAEVSLELEVSPTVAFDTLAAHDGWAKWMPRSFLPVGPSVGTLKVGEKARVKIAGAPVASTLRVTCVDRPREIAWCGGVKGLVFGDHHFLFEATEKGTRVRSVETWTGVLAGLIRPLLLKAAKRVGDEQLAGLRQAALVRAAQGQVGT